MEEEEEGFIGKWQEQEEFNEDEGTVCDMAKHLKIVPLDLQHVLLYYCSYFCFLPDNETPYHPYHIFKQVRGTHSSKCGHAKDEKREGWEND